MNILIKNGHVLDPKNKIDEVMDVWIQDDIVLKVEKEIAVEATAEDVTVLDATGKYVMPGFIDLHVHLRDPGLEYKETLKTGGDAAVKGGVTTLCAMPNTKPVIDTPEKAASVMARAKIESKARVIQIGAVTVGQAGDTLADIQGMAEAGCYAISEDGKSVMDTAVYRRGMIEAQKAEVAIFAHCEDITLVEQGVMNKSAESERLGVKGISNSVEDVIVARDILLAKETGAQLHLCHCSTEDSVYMVREAKKAGLPVTGEVCPHHFILTDEDITENHGRFKMNPPLRSKADVEALKLGLKHDIMDAISTDHAPHSEEEKDCVMEKAAFGIVGIETVAALTYTELVDKGYLTMMQMAEKTSYNPAKILGITDRGSISHGQKADVIIFDSKAEYEIDRDTFVSKGKNTPFHGYPVKGRVEMTIVDGEIVYQYES